MTLAMDSMRKAYARDEVRELIEAREKAERDEVSRIYRASQQGIELGIEKGKLEKSLDIARRMLSLGLDQDIIRQTTGLDTAQLGSLLDE